jgi:predicted TIM-barrel fold metal-dependent hydrolase
MAGVIDADTHIIEHPGIWEHLEPEMYARRPVIVKLPSDTSYGLANACWLVDGELFPRSAGKGSFGMHVPGGDGEEARQDIPPGIRNLTEVKARVGTLDGRGVDIEVIYPTLFLMYLTSDVALEVALCRAYNTYMAKAWSEGGGRLRWTAPLPLRSIAASLEAMDQVKRGGAVGVVFRGVEGDRSLAEEYFYPIYRRAQDLDLAICIHTGGGAPAITRLFDIQYSHVFPHVRMMPLIAFRDIVARKVPEQFPGLRFGFIEAAASWVPFLMHYLRRGTRAPQGLTGPDWAEWWGPRLFREYRLFVACEADEDIPYLVRFTGEDNLIIGSDYGHRDQSHDNGVVATLRGRADVTPSIQAKILQDNPARFYGLS